MVSTGLAYTTPEKPLIFNDEEELGNNEYAISYSVLF